jgi:hypothetical protein
MQMAMIKCPECKKKISDTAKSCPRCGNEITEDMLRIAFDNKKRSKKKKKIAIIIGIIVILLAIGSGTCLYFVKKNNEEKAEQERIEMQKQKEAEEQENAEQEEKEKHSKRREFKKILFSLYGDTDEFVSYLSKKSIVISHTWYNCIFEIKDKETNKYTLKKNGKFKEFSNAVSDCCEKLIYSNKCQKMYDSFKDDRTKYNAIKTNQYVKDDYADIISETDDYLDNIQSYYNQLSIPTGTYETYVESINSIGYKLEDNATSLSDMISDLKNASSL